MLHHGADLVAVAALAIVLFDDFEEASVVDGAVLLELLDLVHDAIELRLELLEAGLGGIVDDRGRGTVCGHWGRKLLELGEGGVGAVLEEGDLFLLKLGDLFQLNVEDLVAEAVFVVLGPYLVVIVELVFAEESLELVVINVLILPRPVDGLAKSLAESHSGERAEKRGDEIRWYSSSIGLVRRGEWLSEA